MITVLFSLFLIVLWISQLIIMQDTLYSFDGKGNIVRNKRKYPPLREIVKSVILLVAILLWFTFGVI